MKMYPKFSKYLLVVSIIGATLLVAGCNNGVSLEDSGKNAVKPHLTSTDIVFDQFGQIPKAGANKKFAIGIHNTTSKKLALKAIRLINPLSGKVDNTLATIDSTQCIMLNDMASCKFGITSHLSHSGSFVLEAEFNDVNGQSHTATQLIRYNERVEAVKGLAFENDFYELNTPDGNYQLALPLVLTEAFDDLMVTNGNLVCESGYQAGSSCTYFTSGKINGATELIGLKLAAYRGGAEVASKSSSIYALVVANAGNLLVTQPEDLYIGKDSLESSSSVALYNSGNAPATNIKIATNGSKLSHQAGDCGATLESHTSCTFKILANSEFNGSNILTIDYQRDADANNNGHLAVNVYYLKEDSEAQLTLQVYSGGLVNISGMPTTVTEDIVVTNSAIATLEKLVYQLYPQHHTLVVSPIKLANEIPACATDKPLKMGEKCGLRISYTPEQDTAGMPIYRLQLSADYYTSTGKRLKTMVTHENVYMATFANVNIGSAGAKMMGNGFDLTATLNLRQTILELTSVAGMFLPSPRCELDASAAPAGCRLLFMPFHSWDPANVTNSNDPDQPSIAKLPLELTATTTNNVLVNRNTTPATIDMNLLVMAPYVYLPAPQEGASSADNTGITWGAGGVVGTRFEAGKQADGSACPTGQEVQVDNLTGLTWVKAPTRTRYTWTQAQTTPAIPISYCGYTDWRLPTVNELKSLVNYAATQSGSNPAAWLNGQNFTNVQAYRYWSSTAYFGNRLAWYVSFDGGHSYYSSVNNSNHVWPVRGGY